MPESVQWQLQPQAEVPPSFLQAVSDLTPEISGRWAAQLLWQRGIRDEAAIRQFVDPAHYEPASPFAFGAEMQWAIARLTQAFEAEEAIAIWGDFDADGITATAVLWEGLGQFFPPLKQLSYHIPNRFTESHGLSQRGIDQLAAQGCRLIVTCDTGSTNLREIVYAQEHGIDIIVTDHHTLLEQRPPVVALINPRALPPEHPLATLSGVAVAYKLVQALYETLPTVPTQPLDALLDLVAIGLIADLVELRGDCRYLAQRGIQQLRKNTFSPPPRPGIARLLELCQGSGDRPTDISFGIGPRINAISRIHGDARFGVELLTSRDPERCRVLAEETEMANTRRKALQRDVADQVQRRLAQLDLSTTAAIVLADTQWSPGVLGLVAGQIAQDYGRPTFLFQIEGAIARGSARSVNNIDLYHLVKGQEALLLSFGGHPLAAGMSLSVDHLPLFSEAINRQVRQEQGATELIGAGMIEADLEVSVADLGQAMFREFSLLEPYGMGNRPPRLLLRHCWFERVWNRNIQDFQNRTVRYIRTTFEIHDNSPARFEGVWWGHYKDEIPPGRCEAIAELDFNPRKARDGSNQDGYELRLIAVRALSEDPQTLIPTAAIDDLLDWRTQRPATVPESNPILEMTRCPSQWDEFQVWVRRAHGQGAKLAIAYPPPVHRPPLDIWRDLVGIAKYLSRTGQSVRRAQLLDRLEIGDRSLSVGFQSLKPLGFTVSRREDGLCLGRSLDAPEVSLDIDTNPEIEQFQAAVREEQFHRQYFYDVPLKTLQAAASSSLSKISWQVEDSQKYS